MNQDTKVKQDIPQSASAGAVDVQRGVTPELQAEPTAEGAVFVMKEDAPTSQSDCEDQEVLARVTVQGDQKAFAANGQPAPEKWDLERAESSHSCSHTETLHDDGWYWFPGGFLVTVAEENEDAAFSDLGEAPEIPLSKRSRCVISSSSRVIICVFVFIILVASMIALLIWQW